MHRRWNPVVAIACLAFIVTVTIGVGQVPARAGDTAAATVTATAATTQTVLLAPGTKYETPLYVVKGAQPGPTVMIVGGVNGGQPASEAAAQVAATYGIDAGTLLVLPQANKPADTAGVAWVSGDVNLQTAFPTASAGTPNGPLATAIWNVVKQYQVSYLIDLHEGPTYYVTGSSSQGNTVLSMATTAAKAFANDVLNAINASTAHPFVALTSPIAGSLPRAASDYLGVNALLVRTTTSEPLADRTAHAVAAVNAMLARAGINVTSQIQTLAEGTKYATPLYVIKGANPGPTVMVVGGINGGQPASEAAAKVATAYGINSGTLLVLPQANIQADTSGVAWVSGDVNLQTAFPTSGSGAANGPLATAIWNAVKQYKVKYLIDLHEGPTYYVKGTSSLGNTVLSMATTAARSFASEVLSAINANATHPFVSLTSPAPGSLPRAASDYLGVNALLVRTTTTEQLADRTAHGVAAINAMLSAAGITVNGDGNTQPTPPPPTGPEVQTVTLAAGTKYATPLYILDSGVPGPVFWVSGGVHGNEPAGYDAGLQLKDDLLNGSITLTSGKLLVLPQANILGDQAHSRYIEGTTDLNRLFPTASGTAPTHPLALAIWNAIKSYHVQYLLDMHEAYDYYKNTSNTALGQTIIYYPSTANQNLAEATISNLNTGISDPYHQFVTMRYPVPGSEARAAGQFLGINASIIETSVLTTTSERVGYDIQAVKYMLSQVGMTK